MESYVVSLLAAKCMGGMVKICALHCRLPADWSLQHLQPIPILVEAALHRPDPEKTGQNIEPNPCVEILI
nr:unnamed protein product [Callosobruchus chinensis]